MDPHVFIEEAIDAGEKAGFSVLDPLQQIVFAISEAEVTCDLDGINSLIDRYGSELLPTFERAFSLVGAADIAHSLAALAKDPTSEQVLSRTNSLIAARTGYDYVRVFGRMSPRASNSLFDSDTQRHCAARRAGEHAPRGAMPLRAGQLGR